MNEYWRISFLELPSGRAYGRIGHGLGSCHGRFRRPPTLSLFCWDGVSLFGIFYHLHPAIDHSRLALIQVLVWIVGTLAVTLGVALIHSGHAIGDPFAALGSVTVLADMLLFGWLVIRRQQGVAARSMASRRLLIPNGGGAGQA